MPLQSANSPLVSGGTATTMATQTTVKVRALRAFLHQGKRVEPKAQIELPKLLALELATSNKVEIVRESASASTKAAAGDKE